MFPFSPIRYKFQHKIKPETTENGKLSEMKYAYILESRSSAITR